MMAGFGCASQCHMVSEEGGGGGGIAAASCSPTSYDMYAQSNTRFISTMTPLVAKGITNWNHISHRTVAQPSGPQWVGKRQKWAGEEAGGLEVGIGECCCYVLSETERVHRNVSPWPISHKEAMPTHLFELVLLDRLERGI